MEHPIRSAFSFFSQRYERILLLILMVQLPLLLVHFFLANYIYAVTPTFSGQFSTGDIFNAMLILLLFLFAQIPFLYFWHYEEAGEDKALRKAMLQFTIRAFHFFVFAVFLSVIVTIGFGLFFLPGLILLAMYISAPIIAVIEEKSVWKCMKESVQIFKKNHWKIVLLIMTFGIGELIISFFIQTMIMSITTSYLAIVIINLFINTIFFPLFYLMLASLTGKWRNELGLLSVENAAAENS
ncbi:hypothetical protein [Jeotgalibacillus proteolyticus]|uniref:Glycerophosphoryl diester phosphodiesterase membrane domain-containing protein n=1 Tax=Jeotgalibacillus proteolyticus TaxID=2082395 RepID=A0A2S5G6V0_9BACL|nr:hypothetical protein [Jeotgalibacillus proteolyticus]PPA68654.1 hypothetical protein C4B60_20275 [Jeotgalibacillus proteolyticus]